MVQQIRECAVNRLLRDQVIVVQDQHNLLCLFHKSIDKRRQDGLHGRGLLRVQVAHKLSTESWLHVVQGREDIGPEADQVIVPLIQGHPGHTRMIFFSRMHPGREQGGLAKACRGRDQGERAPAPLIEQTRQARTRDEGRREGGHEEFGGEQLLIQPVVPLAGREEGHGPAAAGRDPDPTLVGECDRGPVR